MSCTMAWTPPAPEQAATLDSHHSFLPCWALISLFPNHTLCPSFSGASHNFLLVKGISVSPTLHTFSWWCRAQRCFLGSRWCYNTCRNNFKKYIQKQKKRGQYWPLHTDLLIYILPHRTPAHNIPQAEVWILLAWNTTLESFLPVTTKWVYFAKVFTLKLYNLAPENLAQGLPWK